MRGLIEVAVVSGVGLATAFLSPADAATLTCGGAGSITDPAGDATHVAGAGISPDIVCASATYDKSNLTLTVTFAPNTFHKSTTTVQFALLPGSKHPPAGKGDYGNYYVNAGSLFYGNKTQDFEYLPKFVYTASGVTKYYDNGLQAVVPLTAVGGSGQLYFEVVDQTYTPRTCHSCFTTILDYAPNPSAVPNYGVSAPLP
jgi:hypothetical protein